MGSCRIISLLAVLNARSRFGGKVQMQIKLTEPSTLVTVVNLFGALSKRHNFRTAATWTLYGVTARHLSIWQVARLIHCVTD